MSALFNFLWVDDILNGYFLLIKKVIWFISAFFYILNIFLYYC